MPSLDEINSLKMELNPATERKQRQIIYSGGTGFQASESIQLYVHV